MRYSPCKRLEVWAYGVDRNDTDHSAFNGNLEVCTGVVGNCGCVHAEDRLLQEMKHAPLTVAISHSPCLECAKALVKAGVESVLYETEYRLTEGLDYLRSNGVYVSHKEFSQGLISKVMANRTKSRYGGE